MKKIIYDRCHLLSISLVSLFTVLCSVSNCCAQSTGVIVIDSVKIYSMPLLRSYFVEKDHNATFVRANSEQYSISKDPLLCRKLFIFTSSMKNAALFETDLEKVNQCRIVIDFFHQGGLYKSLGITKQGNYFFFDPKDIQITVNKNNSQIGHFIKTFLGTYYQTSSIEMK